MALAPVAQLLGIICGSSVRGMCVRRYEIHTKPLRLNVHPCAQFSSFKPEMAKRDKARMKT
jgi:hypothetical protein